MLITYLICERKWKKWIIISADFYYFSANTIIWWALGWRKVCFEPKVFAFNQQNNSIPVVFVSYLIFAQIIIIERWWWWKIVLFVFHFRFVFKFPDSLNIPEYKWYLLYVAGLWQGIGWNISRKFSINNYSKLCILITYTSK